MEIRLQLGSAAKLSVVNAIGAGDTVAGSMLLHWTGQLNREELVVHQSTPQHHHHHLHDQSKEGDEDFSEIEDRYRRRMQSLWETSPRDQGEGKMDREDEGDGPEIILEDDPLVAFLWGLACGTASCLKERNSQFELIDALHFFRCFQLSV